MIKEFLVPIMGPYLYTIALVCFWAMVIPVILSTIGRTVEWVIRLRYFWRNGGKRK